MAPPDAEKRLLSSVGAGHQSRKGVFWAATILFLTVGTGLRLYRVSEQILVDDEWHSLSYVIGKGYWDVLTSFNPVDNSSPLFNIFNLLLLRTVGWRECAIRLPMITAGLLTLVMLPVLVGRIFNKYVALTSAGLLAISPFLIFYSRYARPYSFVVLFGFAALLLLHQWFTTARTRYAIGALIAGTLAIYAHLTAIIAVFVPLFAAVVFRQTSRCRFSGAGRQQVAVRLDHLATLALVQGILLLPLLLPVLFESDRLPWQRGILTWEGFLTAATLLSGTRTLLFAGVFLVVAAGGYSVLLRRNLLLGCMFACVVVGYLLLLLVSRPAGMEAGAIMLRYLIIVVPIVLTCFALALDEVLSRLEAKSARFGRFRTCLIMTVVACLFLCGPLSVLDKVPNNFMNHSAFHSSYGRINWECSVTNGTLPILQVCQNEVPSFYGWIHDQPNIRAVIEYPFDICDYNDVLYYYQHFHAKRVIAGFCGDQSLAGGEDFGVGMLSADEVLARVPEPQKQLKFANMVDIKDQAALTNIQADVIILHHYLMALRFTSNRLDRIRVEYKSLEPLKDYFQKNLGPPCYEDAQITCFRLKLSGTR